jgi:thiol-disulfide isomerase/thioredoxin
MSMAREARAMKKWLCALGLVAAFGTSQAAPLDLTAYSGKVVYLDFWASWCTPCRQSFPWLNSLTRKYSRRDLVVIGVNVDQARGLADKFLKETPAEFPIIFDPQGDIAASFSVIGMPSAALIDRSGHVRFQHTGFTERRREDYEQQVQGLVAERPTH